MVGPMEQCATFVVTVCSGWPLPTDKGSSWDTVHTCQLFAIATLVMGGISLCLDVSNGRVRTPVNSMQLWIGAVVCSFLTLIIWASDGPYSIYTNVNLGYSWYVLRTSLRQFFPLLCCLCCYPNACFYFHLSFVSFF